MKAIIMAAGKGTRINDAEHPMPKVLRKVGSKPILDYVFDAVSNIERKDISVIVGYMHEMVEEAFADYGCNFVLQGDEGYGTGYAVMCALKSKELTDYDGDVIILSGDTPTVKKELIEKLIRIHNDQKNSCTLLSINDPNNRSFGKVIRCNDRVSDIVEVKDCTEEQLKVTEVNAGLYIFNVKHLREALSKINNDNKANEYYLTDAPKKLIEAGLKVGSLVTDDISASFGINTFEELKRAEELLGCNK